MSACATLRRHMTQTLNPPTADAKVVEGSDGLLLEIDGQIVPNYDATFAPFEEGEVVSGRVVRIDNDEVLVDIGYKSEGVIPSNELSIRKNVDPHDEVELGEEVDALVLTKEDQDGRLIMSKKRARFEKAWRRIEAAAESGEPVEGTVIEVVKGGLIIDLGVRGFLPASLVDIRRVPNLDEYMGTKIESKVIELNRSRNNVVPQPPRRARGGAQGAAPGDPRPAAAGHDRRGPDLEHRRLRRLRRPQRHRRPHPHLRALVVARQPPERGPQHRRHRAGQGPRHRPRPPAHLPGPQADPGGPVAARRRHLQRRRRARGHGHQGRHLRRLRRDPRRRRGPRAHLRAGQPPRREPARGRPAGRRRQGAASSRSTPSAGACRCRSSASRARSCPAASPRARRRCPRAPATSTTCPTSP